MEIFMCFLSFFWSLKGEFEYEGEEEARGNKKLPFYVFEIERYIAAFSSCDAAAVVSENRKKLLLQTI